jgi:hypothetical protein
MSKELLRTQILTRLAADLALQTAAARLARDEAISEESRAENKYDTHSQEAAYLAEGQARIATEINAAIAVYQALPLPDFSSGRPIALGALVETAVGQKHSWYFLGPRAGGLELNLPDGRNVLVLTPGSPLGRQLMGRRSGENIAPPAPGTAAPQLILQVL